MAGMFAQAFKGQRKTLIDMIDVNSTFLDTLQDAGIIDRHEKERLQAERRPYERGSQLFDYLERSCQDRYFEPFCDILKDIREDAVNRIRANLQPFPDQGRALQKKPTDTSLVAANKTGTDSSSCDNSIGSSQMTSLGLRLPVLTGNDKADGKVVTTTVNESQGAAAGNTDEYDRSRSANSTITHVIAAHEDREGSVKGVTVHGNELFVVRSEGIIGCKGEIEVYNAKNFTFKRIIKLKKLKGQVNIHGLTSCDSNDCLYVGYFWLPDDSVGDILLRAVGSWRTGNAGGYIAKVELNGDNKVVKWKLGNTYEPKGLSINCEQNLIVACTGWQISPKLIEYTTRGELVREIILIRDEVVYPRHAIQLNKTEFLVSHGDGNDTLHQVCAVDHNGRVLRRFGDKRGSQTGRLNEPRQLVVDKNGFIFVADRDNNRIVVLDRELKWSRDLKIGRRGVKAPYSLYLDEHRNLLFVGEVNDCISRVVVATV